MRFGLTLELSNVDLLNIDLLDTDIPGKYFACLHNVFKTSSRHLQDMSSRRLQSNNFSSSKTSSRRLQDVFKMSSRRLQDVLEDLKLLR